MHGEFGDVCPDRQGHTETCGSLCFHVFPNWLLGSLVYVSSLMFFGSCGRLCFCKQQGEEIGQFFGCATQIQGDSNEQHVRPLQSNRLTFGLELGKNLTGYAGYADQKVWESDT